MPKVSALLRESKPGTNFVSINAGVCGYGPWQERIFLEREGFHYEPDVVILGLCLNDVTKDFEFELMLIASGLEWSGIYRFARSQRISREIGRRLPGTADGYDLSVRDLFEEPLAESTDAAWQATLLEVRKIVYSCRERSVPLMIVIFPHALQLQPDAPAPKPRRRLGSFCLLEEVPFLDLLPAFIEILSQDQAPDLLYDAWHLTLEGHLVAARAIAGALRAHGLVAVGAAGPIDD